MIDGKGGGCFYAFWTYTEISSREQCARFHGAYCFYIFGVCSATNTISSSAFVADSKSSLENLFLLASSPHHTGILPPQYWLGSLSSASKPSIILHHCNFVWGWTEFLIMRMVEIRSQLGWKHPLTTTNSQDRSMVRILRLA